MSGSNLNYCRQIVKYFTQQVSKPNFPKENKQVLSHVIDLALASNKFLLPSGGRLFDDKEFRALDENEPLRLPYPMIAMEYEQKTDNSDDDYFGRTLKSSKRVIFARERSGFIVMTVVVFIDDQGIWGPMPEFAIPTTGYLDRSNKSHDGRVSILGKRQDDRIPFSDYSDEAGAMLCFLNALQCSNVKIERKAAPPRGKKAKTAHAFDSYHILTIDANKHQTQESGSGSHRSPREHLRRGHIRRLENRKVWVNATVVASGSKGCVTKDYRMDA